MSGRSFIRCAVVAMTTVAATPSLADFRVCNKAREKVLVAFGYEAGRNGWVAEGWWSINHGSCTTVFSGNLRQRYYYLFAESESDDNDHEWSGDQTGKGAHFCTNSNKFKIFQRKYDPNNEEACQKGRFRLQAFFRGQCEGKRELDADPGSR
jgi:uncharacterized membrane protein